MMYFIVLFLVPLAAGLSIHLIPSERLGNYRLLLVFAGSYLFAITITHILPEIYHSAPHNELVGIFVLAGFFLQQVLENFTTGVEHGHLSGGHADHHHHSMPVLALLVALSIHAFMEGGMLAHPESGEIYNANLVLLGIALHRGPAAFALMSLVLYQRNSRTKAFLFLLIFSLASPLGLVIGDYLTENQLIGDTTLIYIYALVCGNFLHISTTIVFESTPGHRFDGKKVIVAIIGAVIAICTEYML